MNQQPTNDGVLRLWLNFFNIFLHWKELGGFRGTEDIDLMNLYDLVSMIGDRDRYLYN